MLGQSSVSGIVKGGCGLQGEGTGGAWEGSLVEGAAERMSGLMVGKGGQQGSVEVVYET